MSDTPLEVVNAYFAAMRGGRAHAAALFALFDEDAVYDEPFGGERRVHRGRSAIEAAIAASWEQAPQDLTLDVDRADVDGPVVVSEWTCRSPSFPAPIRGRDRCEVRDGRIVALEVTLLEDGA